jgi:DNA-binding HxlR family transcriptional regulator
VPLRSDWSSDHCPIARSLDVLGDPWTVLILRHALLGVRRFEDFRSALGVADNVLSRRLTAMVGSGLLRRAPYRGEQRTHLEYRLTEAGEDALPVLHALLLWGERHAPKPGGRMRIVHRTCGRESTAADRCTSCGGELRADEVGWLRPWRSAEPSPLVGASGGPD